MQLTLFLTLPWVCQRPGGKFVSKVHGASTSGKWFEILRDANEKYIAQYDECVPRLGFRR